MGDLLRVLGAWLYRWLRRRQMAHEAAKGEGVWPLHPDVDRAVQQILPELEYFEPDVDVAVWHEPERHHVVEFRGGGTLLENLLHPFEKRLSEERVLIQTETFPWGRAWVVKAAPAEEGS